LEGEGIPAHKLRDAITQLFKENNLEIDEEMLKDIIQEDEIEETTAMSASILENVNPSAMAPQLEAQRQDLSEKNQNNTPQPGRMPLTQTAPLNTETKLNDNLNKQLNNSIEKGGSNSIPLSPTFESLTENKNEVSLKTSIPQSQESLTASKIEEQKTAVIEKKIKLDPQI